MTRGELVVTCQHCGKLNRFRPYPRPGQLAVKPQSTSRLNHLFESETRSPFGGQHSLRSEAATLPGNYDKTTPVSKIETGDITAAAYDAGISLAIAGVGATGIMLLVGYSEWYVAGPMLGFVVGAGRYFGMVNFAKGLTKIIESWGSDEVEVIEAPEPLPKVPPLEVVHKNERGAIQSIQRFNHLPQNVLENFPHFAQQAEIKGLSVDAWTGAGGVFSKSEFNELMNALAEAGIVEWVNPNAKAQGRRVTRSGARALAELAKMT